MQKIGGLLAGLVLFGAFGSAAFFVVQPVVVPAQPGEIVHVGQIVAGQSFAVHVEKKSGLSFGWFDVLPGEGFPVDWGFDLVEQPETLVIEIRSPSGARRGNWLLPLEFRNALGESQTLSLEIGVFAPEVVETVLIEPVDSVAEVGKPFVYRLIVNNEGLVGDHLTVSSNLHEYWFSPFAFDVGPNEKVEREITVTPRVQGERRVEFFVRSNRTTMAQTFFFNQTVRPGVPESFWNSLYGFNFFAPTLSGYYWLAGALSGFS